MEENKKEEKAISDDYITVTIGNSNNIQEDESYSKKNENSNGRRARIVDSKIKKGKKHRKKWSKKKKIVFFSIIGLIIAILGVVLGTYIYKADGNIAEAVLDVASDIMGTDEPIFVLLLGISEDISTELTDTIMLCGYNPGSQKAFMVSIPRDTFVGTNEATAGGFDKINAKYQKGVEKTVDAVEKLTGVEINNYAVVKNTVLPAIVDAIGEVEFDVPIDMDYDDPTQDLHIHLKKGVQKINGDKAEQLLRFRHNNNGSSYPASYGDNDYGRMRTQREFIKSVAGQLISWQNVSKVKSISSAVFNNLETNLSITKMLGYIPYGLKFDVSTLRMEQLPGNSQMINELSFYKANSSKSKELMDKLMQELELDEKELATYYKKKIQKTNNSTTKPTNKKENTVGEVPTTKPNINATNTATDVSTNVNTNTNKPDASKQEQHKHDYNIEGSITKQATCKSSGTKTMKCSCGDVITVSIDPMAHSYSDGKCTFCGITDPSYKPSIETNTTKEPDPPVPVAPVPTPEIPIEPTPGDQGNDEEDSLVAQ